MIGKISGPRGERVEPLIRYLYGPGRHEEHTDRTSSRMAAPTELEPPLAGGRQPGLPAADRPAAQPHEAMGNFGLARPVWHCAVRAAARGQDLSDDELGQIARDVMHRTGLAPTARTTDAVRWIAVRTAMTTSTSWPSLARQDGRRPSHQQRPVPGPGSVPGCRATVRAALHRPSRPHRGPPSIASRE